MALSIAHCGLNQLQSAFDRAVDLRWDLHEDLKSWNSFLRL